MIKTVNTFFSTIAKRYDRMNTLLTLNIDKLWRKKAIRLCNIKKGYKVIDLCCGIGQMIEEIYRQAGNDTSVIGLDCNDEMLAVADKKLNNQSNGIHFDLVNGDVLNIPYSDSNFDVVTIAFGIRNIPNHAKALNEMYRVLKPGGSLICLELSKPTVPVFRNIYDIYFNHILPFLGYIGTGDMGAYYYLRDSVNHFMKKPELQSAFKAAGFKNTGYISLTGGIASIHFGQK